MQESLTAVFAAILLFFLRLTTSLPVRSNGTSFLTESTLSLNTEDPIFDDLVTARLNELFAQYPTAKLDGVSGTALPGPATRVEDFSTIIIVLNDYRSRKAGLTWYDPSERTWSDPFWQRVRNLHLVGQQPWSWEGRGSTLQEALDRLEVLGLLDQDINDVSIVQLQDDDLPERLTEQPIYEFSKVEEHMPPDVKVLLGVRDLKVIDPADMHVLKYTNFVDPFKIIQVASA